MIPGRTQSLRAPGQAMIATLSLLDKEDGGSKLFFWKRKPAERTAALVDELDATPIANLGLVARPLSQRPRHAP